MSEVPFTLRLEGAVSALSIVPYFPFPRVRLVHQEVRDDGAGGVESILWFTAAGLPRCSGCGHRGRRIHSVSVRAIRDLPLGHARVTLMIPHRKLRCRRCGVRTECHDFLSPYRRNTLRYERAVAELCRVLPVQHVAAHFGLDWHSVKEIDKRRLGAEVGPPNYDGLRYLAIDEIAVHKGHSYMTVVLDLDTGRVVWMGPDRSKNTVLTFFAQLTTAQQQTIQAVAIDMSPAYEEAIATACPHARIVYDLFHVVAKYGREVVDRVRIAEAHAQRGQAGRQLIKRSRYLLLKNEENLVGDQRERLEALLAANRHLNTVYILKDQLKEIWRFQRPASARRALAQWSALAEASGLGPLIRFAQNLQKHAAGILNHCGFPLGTSRLEGINNKIKVIKRMAYGFRDEAYFILKIKGAFPGELHSNPR